ncbi:MAG: NADH-quinone oxidoreductase subunit NuoK [Cytophagales bacterium]
MIPIQHYLYISACLFSIGLAIVLTKKHTIVMLMGIELIFNAANINLIAFGQNDPNMKGQMFSLFVIMIAACETAVALAIILNVYRHFKTTNPALASEMKG